MLNDEHRIAKRRGSMPGRFRKMYDKAMNGRSRRAAIFAKCYECLGWEVGRETDCTSPECPLYRYRPFADTTIRQELSHTQRQAAKERLKSRKNPT